jgi:hypothetical protein
MTKSDARDHADDEGEQTPARQVHNEVAAETVSMVVQAGSISGDIYHHPGRGDSQLELSAVIVTEDGPKDASSAVLDLRFRNIGDQPALLHQATFHIHEAADLSLKFLSDPPYQIGIRKVQGGPSGYRDASHSYDIALPAAGKVTGRPLNMNLSQHVEPADTDRFLIRLGIDQSMSAYLFHFDIHYDTDRVLTSPVIAITRPVGRTMWSIDDIRRGLRRFRDAVEDIRDAVNWEMITKRGLPAPDWDNHPPTSPADLPATLRSVSGLGDGLDAVRGSEPSRDIYIVNDAFWNPDDTVTRRLSTVQSRCARIVSISKAAHFRHDTTAQIQTQAETILAQLPALHAAFTTLAKATVADQPNPSGDSDVADDLVHLLGRQPLERLQSRANAGEQDAVRELNIAASMAGTIRRRDPDHYRVLGARWLLAMLRANLGDFGGAATALAELVPDLARTLGPGHKDTLVARVNLALYRGKAGHAAEAVTALDELVPQLEQVAGSDDERTLRARHHLAVFRGEAGEVAEAATALDELLPDMRRALGSNHPFTLESKRELARWRDQTGPASANGP